MPRKLIPRVCAICGQVANGWVFPELSAHPTCLAKEVARLRGLLKTIEGQTKIEADDLGVANARLTLAWKTARQGRVAEN